MNTTFRDPLRPLFWASILARVLGVLLICAGIAEGAIAWHFYREGLFPDYETVLLSLGGAAVAVFLAGVTCFVAGIYVRRRRFWAILLCMVIASLFLCLVVYSLYDAGIAELRNAGPSIVIVGGLAVAFGVLLILLVRGMRALRRDPSIVHGFTPLMTATKVEAKHD